MTPESQRIAIAEACGEWSWILWGRDQFQIFAPKGITLNWSGEDKETNSMRLPLNGQSLDEAARDLMMLIIPDYLNDLNAMHEAEKALTDKLHATYFEWLTVANGYPEGSLADLDEHECMKLLMSTATQRAEAFLKTLGLWKE